MWSIDMSTTWLLFYSNNNNNNYNNLYSTVTRPYRYKGALQATTLGGLSEQMSFKMGF